MPKQAKHGRKNVHGNSYKFDMREGMCGFLVMASRRMENKALQEMKQLFARFLESRRGKYNTLTEFEPQHIPEESIEDALEKELADIKENQKLKAERSIFKQVETGSACIGFLRIVDMEMLGSAETSPSEFLLEFLEYYGAEKIISRHVMRVIPVDATCAANLSEITKTVSHLMNRFFSTSPLCNTYAVLFRHRNNSRIYSYRNNIF